VRLDLNQLSDGDSQLPHLVREPPVDLRWRFDEDGLGLTAARVLGVVGDGHGKEDEECRERARDAP